MRGTDKARSLRRSQTDAEAKLWRHLRNRHLGGFKFRQVPVRPFVVDFLCVESGVVVEIDGGQHVERAQYDARRTQFLELVGYHVVRYWDDDVPLRTDEVLEDLLSRIRTASQS